MHESVTSWETFKFFRANSTDIDSKSYILPDKQNLTKLHGVSESTVISEQKQKNGLRQSYPYTQRQIK